MMILNFRATLSHQNSEGGQWTQEIKRDDTEINFKSHALPFRFPRLPGLHVQVAPRSYSGCCQIGALSFNVVLHWHFSTAYNSRTITFTKFWVNYSIGEPFTETAILFYFIFTVLTPKFWANDTIKDPNTEK